MYLCWTRDASETPQMHVPRFDVRKYTIRKFQNIVVSGGPIAEGPRELDEAGQKFSSAGGFIQKARLRDVRRYELNKSVASDAASRRRMTKNRSLQISK